MDQSSIHIIESNPGNFTRHHFSSEYDGASHTYSDDIESAISQDTRSQGYCEDLKSIQADQVTSYSKQYPPVSQCPTTPTREHRKQRILPQTEGGRTRRHTRLSFRHAEDPLTSTRFQSLSIHHPTESLVGPQQFPLSQYPAWNLHGVQRHTIEIPSATAGIQKGRFDPLVAGPEPSLSLMRTVDQNAPISRSVFHPPVMQHSIELFSSHPPRVPLQESLPGEVPLHQYNTHLVNSYSCTDDGDDGAGDHKADTLKKDKDMIQQKQSSLCITAPAGILHAPRLSHTGLTKAMITHPLQYNHSQLSHTGLTKATHPLQHNHSQQQQNILSQHHLPRQEMSQSLSGNHSTDCTFLPTLEASTHSALSQDYHLNDVTRPLPSTATELTIRDLLQAPSGVQHSKQVNVKNSSQHHDDKMVPLSLAIESSIKAPSQQQQLQHAVHSSEPPALNKYRSFEDCDASYTGSTQLRYPPMPFQPKAAPQVPLSPLHLHNNISPHGKTTSGDMSTQESQTPRGNSNIVPIAPLTLNSSLYASSRTASGSGTGVGISINEYRAFVNSMPSTTPLGQAHAMTPRAPPSQVSLQAPPMASNVSLGMGSARGVPAGVRMLPPPHLQQHPSDATLTNQHLGQSYVSTSGGATSLGAPSQQRFVPAMVPNHHHQQHHSYSPNGSFRFAGLAPITAPLAHGSIIGIDGSATSAIGAPGGGLTITPSVPSISPTSYQNRDSQTPMHHHHIHADTSSQLVSTSVPAAVCDHAPDYLIPVWHYISPFFRTEKKDAWSNVAKFNPKSDDITQFISQQTIRGPYYEVKASRKLYEQMKAREACQPSSSVAPSPHASYGSFTSQLIYPTLQSAQPSASFPPPTSLTTAEIPIQNLSLENTEMVMQPSLQISSRNESQCNNNSSNNSDNSITSPTSTTPTTITPPLSQTEVSAPTQTPHASTGGEKESMFSRFISVIAKPFTASADMLGFALRATVGYDLDADLGLTEEQEELLQADFTAPHWKRRIYRASYEYSAITTRDLSIRKNALIKCIAMDLVDIHDIRKQEYLYNVERQLSGFQSNCNITTTYTSCNPYQMNDIAYNTCTMTFPPMESLYGEGSESGYTLFYDRQLLATKIKELRCMAEQAVLQNVYLAGRAAMSPMNSMNSFNGSVVVGTSIDGTNSTIFPWISPRSVDSSWSFTTKSRAERLILTDEERQALLTPPIDYETRSLQQQCAVDHCKADHPSADVNIYAGNTSPGSVSEGVNIPAEASPQTLKELDKQTFSLLSSLHSLLLTLDV